MQTTRLIVCCGVMLAALVVLNLVIDCLEKWLWRRRAIPGTPSNADLLKLAERHPAPQKWYDE